MFRFNHHHLGAYYLILLKLKGKEAKSVPIQAWSGPEDSTNVPRFHDNGAGW